MNNNNTGTITSSFKIDLRKFDSKKKEQELKNNILIDVRIRHNDEIHVYNKLKKNGT